MDRLKRQYYLDRIGVQAWELKSSGPSSAQIQSAQDSTVLPVDQEPDLPGAAGVDEAASLETLQKTVAACTLCELHRTRTQTVFGTGHPHAEWLVIGEAPGFEEDRKGEPFVGRAGQLLTKMLLAIGLTRDQVFITNILKCRPPENRDPHQEEIVNCHPYLHQQISFIQPKIILAMGRIAAQALLDTNTSIGRLRGIPHQYGDTGIPVVATYHPAYLLRSPQQKRRAWEDLKLAVRIKDSQDPSQPG